MNDGTSLGIDYKTKTKLKPAALKTIMPVTLQGKQIIPKGDLKPKKAGGKKKKPKAKGKGKVPTNKDGIPIYKLRAGHKGD